MDEFETQEPELEAETELDAETEMESEEEPIPHYPIGIEQARRIFAAGIDPRDKFRVYLRLSAIVIAVYYLTSGIIGIVSGG